MEGQPLGKQRFYFFDNLRAFIILLVVVFHIGMCYTTWDLAWWCVNDIKKSTFFDYFVLETDVYIMPIMFMIAGYFAPHVLIKNGISVFWRAKVRRIVIPWLGGTLFLAPLIAYSTFFSRMEIPPNYFVFWREGFWGPYYQQGPYWFLGILALFFLILTIFHRNNPGYLAKATVKTTPSTSFFVAFVLVTAVSFFCSNLFFWNDTWLNVKFLFMVQPVRLILHFCYFGLGVYAWKHAWFTSGGYNPRLIPWATAAMVMLFVFLSYRVAFTLVPDVPTLFKAGHALTHAAFCLTVTFALIAIFQRYFNKNHSLWRRLAANSYTIYFIHPCIYIPISCMVQKLDINIWIKYGSVSISSLILCFLIAEYVIRPILAWGQQNENTLFHS
ncbi:MAG: acyltransferase family protein [Sporomusaceae bacterium]|nr:acyltransferase family protein [Sporomusaceae bacterium]